MNATLLKDRKVMLFTSAALCIVLIAGLWGFSHIQKINSPAHQLSLGEKYLSEMKYEEAILAFNKVIEVDPANVEAYLGMAEAHIGLGDVEEAIRILQEAYDRLGDIRLKEKLDELQGELAAPQGSTWGNISFENMKPEHQVLLYEFIRLFREDDVEQMLALLQEEEEAVRSIVERYMGIHLYVQVEDLKIGLMHMLINPGGSIEIREENGSVIYCYFNNDDDYTDYSNYDVRTVMLGTTADWNWNGSHTEYRWLEWKEPSWSAGDIDLLEITGPVRNGVYHGEIVYTWYLYDNSVEYITDKRTELYEEGKQQGIGPDNENGEKAWYYDHIAGEYVYWNYPSDSPLEDDFAYGPHGTGWVGNTTYLW